MSDPKIYIKAQDLLEDAFRLGLQILQSDFRPDFIAAIWRGGTPVGIAVQELLQFQGIPTDHIAIRTSSYEGIGKRGKEIRVHGLDYLVEKINADNDLLIVDDVYDTGLSVQAVLQTLETRARRNTPRRIRVATVYFKPKNNRTERSPDYYLHETDRWLVFPHELEGLTAEEIKTNKPCLGTLLEDQRE